MDQIKKLQEQLEAMKAKRLNAAAGQPTETKSFRDVASKACKQFGAKSLDELIEVNTSEKKFAYISAEKKQAVRDLKEGVDVAFMIATQYGKKVNETKAYEELVEPALKALGIDSGDVGFNWIPTGIATSYIDEYNLDRKVSGLFQDIKMPTNPYEFPVLSNGAVASIVGEATCLSPKDQFGDSKIQFRAVKLSNQYELPEELQEDSAVDVMKLIRQELIEGQEKALEIAILEGDTTPTHQHTNTQIPGASGAPAAGSSERAFDGLRKRALAAASSALKVDAGAAPLNETHLADARKKMGKFGTNPAELALIMGPKGYVEAMQLDDVRTLEQYGPQAPVLSGELAKYEGIPVIVSEWLREDTDATGVNGATPANNVKLSVLLVNRKRWFTATRRAVQVRVENNQTCKDMWDMVSFSRRHFQGVLTANASNAATEKSVVLIYNIA